MREHPEGIRSVVLDSVEPPSVVNVGRFWGNAREGFDNLFRACAQKRGCWSGQAGISETFASVVRELESDPVSTSVMPEKGKPPVKVVIDGGKLVNWLVDMSFATADYPHVPEWIGELAKGHPEKIALSIAQPLLTTPEGYIGYGLTYGVICSEWVPYESESDVLLQGRLAFPDYPDSVLAPAVHFTYIYDDCRGWKVNKGPAAQRSATRSNIPTLILSGSFDAITPPGLGRIAAQTLPNSTVLVIPAVGHFASQESLRAQREIASFLTDPKISRRERCAPLLGAEQIDVEDQRGVRWDDTTRTSRAVTQVRRNDQCALAAHMHGGDAFVPALDDLALADRERKRLTPVDRAVEFLALLAVDEQPSRIIDRHGLASFRHGSGARLNVDNAQAAGCGDLAGGEGR